MPVTPKGSTKFAKAAAAPNIVGTPVDLGGDLSAAVVQPPQLEPMEAFILAYHPARWSIIGGKCAPALARVPIEGGLNGAEFVNLADGRRVADWRQATKRFTDRGYTVIPHNKGPGGTSYMQAVGVKHGTAHLSVWETPHAGSTAVTVDTPGYVEWALSLVDAGEVPPPTSYAFETLRGELDKQRAKAADRAVTQPSAKQDLARLEAEIASVDAMIAKWATAQPVKGEPVGVG